MNFLKKIFGSKVDLISETVKSEDKINEEKVIAKMQQELNEYFAKNYKNPHVPPKFKGIDEEFIDLIFFETSSDKESYIKNINDTLLKLNIKTGDDRNEVIEKTYNYNNLEPYKPIPFLRESLILQHPEEAGIKKIQSYYPAANFIEENIKLKLNSKNSDFDFEEELFEKYLIKSDLNNYAKINATFCLGEACLKQNNVSRTDFYFDIIRNTHWGLALSTTSNYYKYIGEAYAAIGDNIKALKWLKAGLEFYPKLGGVSRLISKLEKIKLST
jgi:hypothetical protein